MNIIVQMDIRVLQTGTSTRLRTKRSVEKKTVLDIEVEYLGFSWTKHKRDVRSIPNMHVL